MATKVIKKRQQLKGITFHSTNPREFVLINLDFSENQDLFDENIEDYFRNVKDAIIKVNIRIKSEDLHKLDINQIKMLVKDAFYCNEIVPLIIKQNVIRISRITPDLTVNDAINIFIQSKNPKRSKEILELSLDLIKRVGIDEL